MQNDLDKRYQTLIILWAAMLMSIASWFLILLFIPKPTLQEARPLGGFLLFVLAGVGTFIVVMSFVVKQKFLQRSVDQQDVTLVQKGLVIACAMCEVTALLAVIERLVIGGGDYILLLLIAAAGIALHFPRRSQLIAATWKDQSAQNTL